MSRNIEIKVRIESADAWVPKIAALADEGPVGVREARGLMEKLDIKPHQLIEDAYVDLLARPRDPSLPAAAIRPDLA